MPKWFKEKIKFEWSQARNDTSIVEMIFWWIIRFLIIFAFVKSESFYDKVMFGSNVLACFSISLLRFITPKNSFLNRINYRLETLILIVEFVACYMGSYIFLYKYIPKYDLILHLFSGSIVIFIGYYLLKAIIGKRECPVSVMILCSTFFSGTIISLWEIIEFISDYFMGSTNQGFNWAISEDFTLFQIIGPSKAGPGQYPLFDTMFDIIAAIVGIIITIPIFYKIVKKENANCQPLISSQK